MDFSKIAASVDAERLADSHVLQVGVGGGAQLAMNLARSGVGLFTLIDPDVVSEANLARQQFRHADVGRPKALVVAEAITAINPAAAIQPILLDVCGLPDFVVASLHLTMPDLLLAMTDHFPAQAKVNELSLQFGVPAVFAGLFAGAKGGEVAFVVPGETPCFRCLARNRYAAHEARGAGTAIDPPSDGATVFDDALIDVVAGHLALGLLTRGAPNRLGRLVDTLGDRNYIRLKVDPDDRWHGRDVVREKLQVPAGNDAFFAWSSAALRDPDGGRLPCPDCERYARRPAAPGRHEAPSTPLGP
jgi:molybdopterin/thiamine biosynthesis adenylyltransferase